MITFDKFKEMAEYAHILCNNIQVSNPCEVVKRNTDIINKIMDKYSVDENLAKEVFMNNNNLRGLIEAYNRNFTSDGINK